MRAWTHGAVLIMVLGVLGTWVPERVRASSPRGPVSGITLQFYIGKNFHFNDCDAAGPAATTFPNTVQRVYVNAVYTTYQGAHRVQVKWYRPSGKLYVADDPSTFTNVASTCNYLAVAGQDAENELGRWTVRLFVDRKALGTGHFMLTPVGGPVAVGAISFYNGRNFHFNPCNPSGLPTTVFPNTVGRIYAYIRYVDWQGTHRDRYRWFTPSGRLYDDTKTAPYTAHKGFQACGYLPISGTAAASKIGRWTFQLLLDGRPVQVAYFTLVRGS